MSKKYSYSEYEASKKAKPKIAYEERYCRHQGRNQERRRDRVESEDDFKATYQRMPPAKRFEGCSCTRDKPQVVEMSDSSDLDSIQGFGFIDHYRRRGLSDYLDDLDDGTDINTSELFNVDRYTACLGPKKTSSNEDPPVRETYEGPSASKEYRPSPSADTSQTYELDKPSSSGSSPTEPPKLNKPNFLPMTESYLRFLYRSASPQVPRESRPQEPRESRPQEHRQSRPQEPRESRHQDHRQSRPQEPRESRQQEYKENRQQEHRESRQQEYKESRPQEQRQSRQKEPRHSRQQMEENRGFCRQDKRFIRENPPPRPCIKSPERIPFKNPCAHRFLSTRIPFRNPYAPRSSTRFSPRCHPRQTARCESSDASLDPRSSEKAAETESEPAVAESEPAEIESEPAEAESELSAGQLTESIAQAESESSDLRCDSSERFSEYPSLGKRIVRDSRRNLEMGYRSPRICGGAIGAHMRSPCVRKPAEPRYKVTSPSRIHFRRCCRCPCSEARAKRSSFNWKTYLQPPMAGKNRPMQSLLSPRNLAYSHSTCSLMRSPRRCQHVQESCRPKQRSSSKTKVEAHSEDSHLTPPDLAEFSDLPEVSSSPSGPDPACRCSRGQRLPSLGSRLTFTNVWRRATQFMACNESEIPPTGGLYGQGDKLRFKPIDRLDAGVSLTPIFEGSKSETRRRIRYFANEFDTLSIKERMQDTELRFRTIRKMVAGAVSSCLKHFHGRKAARWPMTPEGHQYVCPIGHKGCPLVTDETILSHKLLYHHDEKGFELREIFMDDRLLLIFNPRSYPIERISCMSVMAYAGIYKQPSTLPGRRFMPIKNKNLPRIYAQYPEHLPIFVMICRLRRGPSTVRQGRHGPVVERDDVLFLWVTSVDLPYPVHVIMTVMNRRMDATRSTVMQVRPLHESQNCLDIMQTSCQYMRLGEQDLRLLTSYDTEPLYLEITVKEFAGTL